MLERWPVPLALHQRVRVHQQGSSHQILERGPDTPSGRVSEALLLDVGFQTLKKMVIRSGSGVAGGPALAMSNLILCTNWPTECSCLHVCSCARACMAVSMRPKLSLSTWVMSSHVGWPPSSIRGLANAYQAERAFL